jgi:hypothetical protein
MAVLKLVANFSLWKRGKSTLGVFSSQPNLLTYSQTMEFGSVLVGNFAKLMKHFGKVDLANRKYYHGKTAKSEKST